jgi:hypothetical protein
MKHCTTTKEEMRGKMESVVHMRVSPIKILAQLFDRKRIVVIICETLLKMIEFTTTNGKWEGKCSFVMEIRRTQCVRIVLLRHLRDKL